jgi:DNA-binding transcriptional MocR family regulator
MRSACSARGSWPHPAGSQQVADKLRAAITSGSLPPGAPLPSVRDLQAPQGIRRSALQRALTVLAGEGLGAFQAAERWRWVDGNPADSVSLHPPLSLLFNPCCLGCPVLLVLPGVSW